METRVRFIIVGAFALAAIVGVFLFAYWIHASGGLSHTRALKVEFQGAAAGLRPGSAVTFNGVRIGEVTRIAFDPARADVVDADLAVDAAAPLRADAKVGVEALHSVVKNVDAFAGALARNSGRIDNIAAGLESLTGHGPKPPPPQFLDLRAPRDFPPLPAPAGQIAVADATAPTAFQTQKILSRKTPESPFTLGEAQWTDVTPKLVQLKLVESFENAGLGGAVSRPIDSGQPDFQLLIDVRRFEIDLAAGEAVVELSARLAGKDGRIAAAKVFHATAPCTAPDGAAAAEGLSAAFDEAAKGIVGWTASGGK